jgi:hypothetical protein
VFSYVVAPSQVYFREIKIYSGPLKYVFQTWSFQAHIITFLLIINDTLAKAQIYMTLNELSNNNLVCFWIIPSELIQ